MLLLTLAACDSESMMSPVEIENVDLTKVADGTYIGEYTDEKSNGMSEVEVIMEEHIIKSITVLKRSCTPIGKKGEYVIDQVLAAQSLEVDGVTGATLTSTVTLKAIEIALKKGIEE